MTRTAPLRHSHATRDGARLAVALVLTLAAAAIEFAGALATDSLALLADFAHVLADVGALLLALAAARVAARPHTMQWTFGFHRAEVLAAAANGLVLLAIIAFVAWRAALRLADPVAVEGGGLLAVAAAGLLLNAAAMLALRGAESLNMRAARLHLVADLAGSLAAVAAGALIATTGWQRADPLLSLAIAALLLGTTLPVLRDAGAVLMDRVPRGIDLAEVERQLRALPGILAVHDIHCWTIATGFTAFAAHLELGPTADTQRSLAAAAGLLESRFGITHITLQPEQMTVHQPVELRD